MGKIALFTGAILLGWLAVSDAQTEAPAAATQFQQANSGAADNSLTKHPSLSLKAENITGERSVIRQFQFQNPPKKESDSRAANKSYNPILIPLW